jgi:integrase
MGHADIDTTSKYLQHRSRTGDARLLSAAFLSRRKPGPRRKKAAATR